MTSYGNLDNEIIWQRQTFFSVFVVSMVICFSGVVFYSDMCFGRAGIELDIALGEKINPNTAESASLVRLSGIGEKRAEDIIEYRESFGLDAKAFESVSDMEKIKGIGPKTAAKIGGWLCFD
jgi:competence ComEA-like helix-hairpin-helix protein